MTTPNKATVFPIVLFTLVVGVSMCGAGEASFHHVCSWAAFDAGDHGVGDDPDGYDGAVFDGRYVYFVPYSQGVYSYHDEVLRFDTFGGFSEPLSWTTFRPSEHGIGQPNAGYSGAVFDGRYVYFAPGGRGASYHGEALRYDTQGTFTDPSSWLAYDPGAHGVGDDPDGYTGAAFDGRYIYFAPIHNGTDFHGEVLRYDTTGDFSSPDSWAAFDPDDHHVGNDPDGYIGAVFDGRFVYFVPNYNGTTHHGEVLRYDTMGDFLSASSWATFDPGLHGVGQDPDGYHDGAFDGRYVYFAPYHNGSTYHGEVLRYDTTADFFQPGSWETFDPGNHGVGDVPDGYHGAVFDGRFIYFVPNYNNTGNHAEVLRFDVLAGFLDPVAWATFDPSDHGVTEHPGGYHRAVFDNRFVYFVPAGWQPAHGEVLRFDTATCPGDVDADGDIDLADLAQLLSNYGISSGATCEDGDLDLDRDVDLADLAELLAHYGDDCP